VLEEQDEKFDIEAFLASELSKDLLRLATAGSVDDGKSTLIGRLLHDARGAYEDQLKSVRRADGVIDFALLTDGLRAEREQGITIDVAYRYFATAKRKFILADTPGHVQYTRNMATGASTAELAIILVDAKRGLTDQSRRHASIAALLGIRHFVIAVNKMDLVNFEYGVFDSVYRDFKPFLDSLGIVEPYFLPMSALLGDNVVEPSANMPWFVGAPLLEHLESIEVEKPVDAAFRMAVQRAVRPDQTFRGYAGQIASGVIRPGDEIFALPSGRRSRVKRIVTYDGDLEIAHAPLSVTLTLEDEIDISRGDMLSAGTEPQNARSVEATVVWFDATPLDPSKEYLLKHTTQTIRARIETDGALKMNDIGEVRISLAQPLFFDAYKSNRTTGSFILMDRETNATAAAGMIK
jgi:sulfate adenylyltransferase large subunit